MQKLLVSSLLVLFSMTAFAQSSKKYGEVEVKTSAICKMCKERIERDLSLTKGVKSADLNLDNKVVTVRYMNSKTSADAIRDAITKIGYDADSLTADQKAHDRLPDCCQKSAVPHVD